MSEASIAYFIRVSSSKNERGNKISLFASGADYAVARLFVEMLRRDTDYYRK
jgi:prolipoprotein diacylglyceryltransferase